MVFQNYALYPHMTVEENLAFGLKLRKLPKAEIEERVGVLPSCSGSTSTSQEAARTVGRSASACGDGPRDRA